MGACDLLTTKSTPYSAAWYWKTSLTFSDALGAVRLQLWVGDINQHSPPNRETQYIPPPRLIRMELALCFAAESYKVELRVCFEMCAKRIADAPKAHFKRNSNRDIATFSPSPGEGDVFR